VKKTSTTVYIRADQDEQLKALSQKTKVPMAEYVRQGVDAILEKHKKLLDNQEPRAIEVVEENPT
jgi:predicted DNA-binding protein